MKKFIETHCHLDYLKDLPTNKILEKAKAEGIEKFITIAVEPDNLEIVKNLAETYEEVFFTQGIHPHEARLITAEAFQTIEQTAKTHPKCVAVGEIGLDYHYDNSPREKQREVFRKHLDLASRIDKPVVIHSREADEDTINILKEFSDPLKKKGVIHSFTAGKKLAEFALSEGFYLGFNGIITFKKAENVRDIVALTPINQILFETDSPFLTPVPHRGKENAPFYLPFIASEIAKILNIDEQTLNQQVYQNSENLFF